ncbi:hypothetical protein G6F53_014036 [Rhizopus delemar]|nr:hypothetical protein G6F53_014036 [Rhizopus delemar]
MLARCGDGIHDHDAGGRRHRDMHGGLADGVARAVRSGEHAVQHRHHDKAAAETEQDRGDAAYAAEQSQYEIKHAVHPFAEKASRYGGRYWPAL